MEIFKNKSFDLKILNLTLELMRYLKFSSENPSMQYMADINLINLLINLKLHQANSN